MRTPQEFREHIDDLASEAAEIAENLARKVLRQPYMTEFVMGMGVAWFIDRQGNHIDDDSSNGHTLDFFNFISEWDDVFQITGAPMRIKRNGEKITDW